MNKKWKTIKSIIGTSEPGKEPFLSLISEDGTIVCANANMVKTLHLQDVRTHHTSFLDLLHPLHLDEFRKAIQHSRMQGEPYSMELYLKNGYYHPMKWQVNQICTDDGDPTYLCMGHKILDDERDAMFNVFLKQTPNLAWVIDEEAKLVFGSRSFFGYFGLDEKGSIGKSILELVPTGIAKALSDSHTRVLETGKPEEMVEKVEWADGTEFVFHINIFPIEGVTSKRMLGGQAVNLAEKYAVEKKLREANERLLMLTRATTDAIWEWDMLTSQIFRNDALMDMIGYQMDDPKGLSWWLRRIHPEDRNRVSDKVKDSTEKKQQSWEDEYRFKCADGTYKHMRDKGYIVYENGLPVKMIGSLQDVTHLRDLESRLMEEKLERQKEISETVIRVQEKERTRIGHELHDNVNQILSTTKLFVDMLIPSDDEQKQFKEKSIDYIMMAIEEIRKLSKELVVSQLQDKGLVESIDMLIDDIHLSTILKIKFTYDHENELVSPGKKITLFRIVQEQLKNILKHSGATYVDIYLQCKDQEVQLTIRDNGIGFDATQTRQGIGLSNIYERTRFYNGEVAIETAPGKGCTLEVRMPAFH